MKLEVYNINGQGVGREVELPQEIFGLELNEKHEHIVYLAVKQYNAHQRQGTHKSKERAEITGSTKKLKRQKGTGTARAGSIKSPVFRGGGRVFGPRPRNYQVKLNKKVKQLARKAVMTSKAQEGNLFVVENLSFAAPKTKDYIKFLNAFKAKEATLADAKTLLVLDAPETPAKPKAPKKPLKPRGAKLRAMYKTAMANYKTAQEQYKKDVVAYEQTLAKHNEAYAAAYKNIVLSGRNLKNTEVVRATDVNVYQILNADYLVLSEGAVEKIKTVLS